MIDCIKSAKSRADVVILSLHWGIHFVPAVIADYQREVARIAVDSGADLIVGHHPHILKPIEVYKGKVIFYSLGNFATDLPFTRQMLQERGFEEIRQLNPEWLPDPEHLYNFPPNAEKSIIAKCEISNGTITKFSFLPVYINRRTAVPEILKMEDERFNEVVKYMEEITQSQGLDTKFEVAEEEVVI